MARLANLAIVLALCTIVLGAYTRLTDAGLGCPDWPGCYGAMVAPTQAAQIHQAQQMYPERKIEPHKARNEMLHRYVAGSLGIAILVIFAMGFRYRQIHFLSALLVMLVIMQAALGMWTVSLNLLPLVVMGHLLGGFSLLSLLVMLRLRLSLMPLAVDIGLVSLRPLAWIALAVLLAQIALGAWTSANYAALACHQLPLCEPGWQARFDIAAAFHLPLGHESYEYGVLSHDARMSIHILHRTGALIATLVIGTLVFLSWRRAVMPTMRYLAAAIGCLLAMQVALGLINVIAYLPLLNAVAHNFIAANLLMLVVVFVDLLHRRRIVMADNPVMTTRTMINR